MINYYLITKPGIIMGNLLTVAAGFLLATTGAINFWLFTATLLGLAFVMASACVFNNYIDRHIDKKMARTQNRPLVTGLISHKNALIFASLLGLLGLGILLYYTNLISTTVAAVGFFVYVLLYSLWKCRTVYGTAIGSIAGAVPPVVGYCAVSHHFDLGALLLFALLVFWQMPHFFSIAIYRFEDYAAASIPVLPRVKGLRFTKKRMVLYILAFLSISILLTTFHYTSTLYLTIATLSSLLWLFYSLLGFKSKNDTQWARLMFRLSLLIITALCATIAFDVTRL